MKYKICLEGNFMNYIKINYFIRKIYRNKMWLNIFLGKIKIDQILTSMK